MLERSDVIGFFVTLVLGLIPIFIFSLPLALRWLAEPEKDEDGNEKKNGKKEVLVLTVPEGRVKPVEVNEKFHHMEMSYAGHEFEGRLPNSTLDPDQDAYWEVVPYDHPTIIYNAVEKALNVPSYQGLHYMGLPFIARVPRYRFTWTEWAQKRENGRLSADKEPIPHEEMIGHILVQSDVYFVQVCEAETKEGVPVTIRVLLTIQVNNPYKARYRVQDWLEAVTNKAEAELRTFVATEAVLSILTVSAGGATGVAAVVLSNEAKDRMEALLTNALAHFRSDYGVTVSLPQIQSVEIAGKDADKYRAAVTAEFEAKATATRVRIAADAEKYRIEQVATAEKKAVEDVLATVAAIEGGVEIYRSQQIGRLGNLTTLVEGDSKGKPGVILPTNKP